MKRREVLHVAGLMSAGGLLSACEPLADEASAPSEATETVRDRMWLWGHPAGSHNEGWNLPAPSQISPPEAAAYLNVPNMIMIRYLGKPEMPFDAYAEALSGLKQVYWSIVGAGGETGDDERKHVIELAGRFPNIVGFFMDDFFRQPQQEGDLGVLSIETIQALRNEISQVGRPMRLGVTLYNYQLQMPLGPYLELFDDVSLWTWKSPDLRNLQQRFEEFEALVPKSDKLLGLYMYDYGRLAPMPVERMERQCRLALQWLQEGRIRGMIFLASCICDLGLEAVEWTKDWIAEVGDLALTGQ